MGDSDSEIEVVGVKPPPPPQVVDLLNSDDEVEIIPDPSPSSRVVHRTAAAGAMSTTMLPEENPSTTDYAQMSSVKSASLGNSPPKAKAARRRPSPKRASKSNRAAASTARTSFIGISDDESKTAGQPKPPPAAIAGTNRSAPHSTVDLLNDGDTDMQEDESSGREDKPINLAESSDDEESEIDEKSGALSDEEMSDDGDKKPAALPRKMSSLPSFSENFDKMHLDSKDDGNKKKRAARPVFRTADGVEYDSSDDEMAMIHEGPLDRAYFHSPQHTGPDRRSIKDVRRIAAEMEKNAPPAAQEAAPAALPKRPPAKRAGLRPTPAYGRRNRALQSKMPPADTANQNEMQVDEAPKNSPDKRGVPSEVEIDATLPDREADTAEEEQPSKESALSSEIDDETDQDVFMDARETETSAPSSVATESGATVGLDDYEDAIEDMEDIESFGVEVPPKHFVFDDDFVAPKRPRRPQRQSSKRPARAVRPIVRDSVFAAYEDPPSRSDSEASYETDIDDQEVPNNYDYSKVGPALVEHVSRLTVDSASGLPKKFLTVSDGLHGDIVYDFEASVGKSSVPDAGYGVHLKYVGAKKLTSKARRVRDDTLKSIDQRVAETQVPRDAETPTGFSTTVTLTGEKLHGDNNGSWPLTACELGINMEKDYVKAGNLNFVFGDRSIELGRYGPQRKQDRKTERHYAVKNYIFSGEPAEWAFDVNERLYHDIQVIDITDDATGSLHCEAKRSICPFVNEVGHSSERTQNVFICEKNERSVYYYVRHETPMKPGETIELFTNYMQAYEAVRERKGYGWKNLCNIERDDSFRANRLKRNFVELRGDAENIITVMKDPFDVTSMVEFIYEEIWRPLAKKAEQCLAQNSTEELSCREWVAILRIQWLRDVFARAIETFGRDPDNGGLPRKGSMNYCIQLLKKMEWPSRSLIVADASNAVIAAIHEELLEGICFRLRKTILLPFDESMWCPMARDFIEKLCRKTSSFMLSPAWDPHPHSDAKSKLLDAILKLAVEFATKIDKAATESLAFESGLYSKPEVVSITLEEAFQTVKRSNAIFLDNSTTPKGFTASLIEKLAYLESLVVGDLEPAVNKLDLNLEPMNRFLMVEYDGIFGNHRELKKLGSVPRSISSVARTSAIVNKTWYLVWMIGYPIHALATEYLGEVYSVKNLCSALAIDETLMEFAVNRGMQHDEDKLFKRLLRVKKENSATPMWSKKQNGAKQPRSWKKQKQKKKAPKEKKSGVGRRTGRIPAKEIYSGKPKGTLDLPGGWPKGWSQKTFQRQSGESKGHTDDYWYTQNGYKLRSKSEIRRFLELLESCKGDEEVAWTYFKQR